MEGDGAWQPCWQISAGDTIAMASGMSAGKSLRSSIYYGHTLTFRASEVTSGGISRAAVLPDMSEQTLPDEEIRRRRSLRLHIRSKLHDYKSPQRSMQRCATGFR